MTKPMVSRRRGQSPAPFILKLTLRVALILLPLLLLCAPSEAHAYQWMLKHQYPTCNLCHTDPSGGELLNAYGRMQSEAALSMWGGPSSGGSATNRREHKPQRLVRTELDAFAARAKLAGKDEETEAEKVVLEESGAEAAATDEASADASEESTGDAGAEAASSEPAADAGYPDGLGPITPFLFRAWEPPDWLLLGGSYRHLNIITPQSEKKFRTFPMMMDVYGEAQFGSLRLGGSLGGARVAVGSPYARAAQITTNQGKDWNLISRTHYVGYDIGALQLRAGRLNLPFGVRVPEHTLWARQETRTDRESNQQHGLSAHYSTTDFRLEVMGIAGNYQLNPDQFRERGYSGYFEYFLTQKTVLGVSSLVTVAKNDRFVLDGESMTRQAHGAMLRALITPDTVWVVEANALLRSRFETGYVGFTQVDHEIVQGLHVMLTGEILDSGHSKAKDAPARGPGAGKPRLGGWLSASWWFLPHFDVRVDAIKRSQEDVSILAQLHAYL